MRCLKITEFGTIAFDPEKVPGVLTCFSECEDMDDFLQKNFLALEADGHSLLLCSWANAAALGDYLVSAAEPSFVGEVCMLLSPDGNYWRRLASEPGYRGGDSFGWELQALKTAFGPDLHIAKDDSGQKWFVVIDTRLPETGYLPFDRQILLEHFCKEQVLAIFEDRYESGNDWDTVLDFDNASEWLKGVYLKFCSMHV